MSTMKKQVTEWLANLQADGNYQDMPEPEWLAHQLNRLGYLAPDLPKPYEHGGKLVWPMQDPDEWEVSLHDYWVRVSDERGAIMTTNLNLARELGLALLAVVNTAENGTASNDDGTAATHPTTLTTWEDYDNAPPETIVTYADGGRAYMKGHDGKWGATACTIRFDSSDLVEGNPGDSTTLILRWGDGK